MINVNPALVPLTNGDLEHFSGHENWPGERFAWEFLRRSPEFRQDSDRARDAVSRKRIASTHCLRAFKNWREDYEMHAPKFKTRFRAFSHRHSDQPTRRLRLILKPGEIAFVVHASWPRALQLEAIRLKLGLAVEKRIHRALPVQKPRSRLLIKMLQILDARASGCTWAQVARLMNPKKYLGEPEAAISEAKGLGKRANEYVSAGYLVLALKGRVARLKGKRASASVRKSRE